MNAQACALPSYTTLLHPPTNANNHKACALAYSRKLNLQICIHAEKLSFLPICLGFLYNILQRCEAAPLIRTEDEEECTTNCKEQ